MPSDTLGKTKAKPLNVNKMTDLEIAQVAIEIDHLREMIRIKDEYIKALELFISETNESTAKLIFKNEEK